MASFTAGYCPDNVLSGLPASACNSVLGWPEQRGPPTRLVSCIIADPLPTQQPQPGAFSQSWCNQLVPGQLCFISMFAVHVQAVFAFEVCLPAFLLCHLSQKPCSPFTCLTPALRSMINAAAS